MKLVLPLLLIGSGAWAECPTTADLAQGIRLQWSNGDVMTVRATDDPVILTARTDDPFGGHYLKRLAWGLFHVELVEDTIDGGAGTIDFGVAPQAMPRPTAGTNIHFAQVDFRVHWPFSERQTFRMGPPGQVTFGSCTYRAFEVTLVTTALNVADDLPPDDPARAPRITQGWAYLVDLGFAVESWFGPPEERRLAPDVTAIEAVQ